MLRTNVYLSIDQDKEISRRALLMRKTKAEVLREVITKGLRTAQLQKSSSTTSFLKLAGIAKSFKGRGTAPKDLSANLDKYIWDK